MKEHEIISWTDPHSGSFSTTQRQALLIAAGIGTVSMFIFALWLHDINYYFAAAVFLAIGFSIAAQKNTQDHQKISLSLTALRIGKQEHPIAELAGFWMRKEGERLWITIESRRSMLPITFAYLNQNEDAAREHFLEVLPELEEQSLTLNDKISGWLKL